VTNVSLPSQEEIAMRGIGSTSTLKMKNSLQELNAIDVRKHLHVKVIYTDILKRVASLERIQASNVNFVTRASKERVT
jgi:hypothetical protein